MFPELELADVPVADGTVMVAVVVGLMCPVTILIFYNIHILICNTMHSQIKYIYIYLYCIVSVKLYNDCEYTF